jgi:asparaginyl-tRNA synthetase
MIFAVHSFSPAKASFNVHTPIITASDAEGAGEMFQVTTLNMENPPRTETGEIDFTQDFFGKAPTLPYRASSKANWPPWHWPRFIPLGPTFRAENSNTSRHLAEFWMIEPEMAFCELEDNMDLAEEFLKYLITLCPRTLHG